MVSSIAPVSNPYAALFGSTANASDTTTQAIQKQLAAVTAPSSSIPTDSVSLSSEVSALLDQFASSGGGTGDLVGTLLGGGTDSLIADSYSSLIKTAYAQAGLKATQDAISHHASALQSILDSYHAALNGAAPIPAPVSAGTATGTSAGGTSVVA